MIERGRPLLRPTVVSSSMGIRRACQPTRPPVSLSTPRCIAFSALNDRSLATGRHSSVRSRANAVAERPDEILDRVVE